MSSNTVRVQVQYSFKGETHALDEVFDLDQISAENAVPPDFHRLLARKSGIDPISYMYEVLESHDIEFSQATGLAANYCRDGQFDWHGFDKTRREHGDWERILAIVQDRIDHRELDGNPNLKAALLDVFRSGASRR